MSEPPVVRVQRMRIRFEGTTDAHRAREVGARATEILAGLLAERPPQPGAHRRGPASRVTLDLARTADDAAARAIAGAAYEAVTRRRSGAA